MTELLNPHVVQPAAAGHPRWVRICHWIATASLATLACTGFVILMAHPRLYWGEVGNDLTPALLELPISRNHQHGGWKDRERIFQDRTSPISANRTYDIFNQNGWGRSLHFLAAWFLVVPGAVYFLAGISTGHFRRHIWPRPGELAPGLLWRDVVRHLQAWTPPAPGAPHYGLLQKCAYSAVAFVGLPIMLLTGMAMSPAVTAAYPFLSGMFGGFQSARTIHFFAFVALLLFVVVHIGMVMRSGFRRQMRGMIVGERE
jgi:thiosulfate reductase cytochrome b subunit